MKRGLALFLAAALSSPAATRTTAATRPPQRPRSRPPAAGALFESSRIAFTFEYPEELAADKTPRAPVLARVAVKPARAAERDPGAADRPPRAPARALPRRVQARPRGQRRRASTTREERIGDLDVGRARGRGERLHLHVVLLHGRRADVAARVHRRTTTQRAKIDAACRSRSSRSISTIDETPESDPSCNRLVKVTGPTSAAADIAASPIAATQPRWRSLVERAVAASRASVGAAARCARADPGHGRRARRLLHRPSDGSCSTTRRPSTASSCPARG